MEENERQIPHNIDAEKSVLGSILIAPEAAEKAMEALKPEDFYKLAHRDIFTAMQRLYNAGKLIDTTSVADVLDKNADATRNGVIFDGFPRTIEQAKALKTMLAERGTQVNAVIGLEVAEEELIDRLIKRGKDSGRSDDNLETIKKRLDVYHNQTSPLRDFYIAEGLYEAIHGSGTVEGIFADIRTAIDARR